MARKKMTKAQRTRQIYIRVTIVLCLLAIAVTALFVVLFGMTKETVDLNACTHFSMTGFNGEGVLSAIVEKDENYAPFFETVSVDISKATGLSNGDEVTISYNYDKDVAKKYNLKIKADSLHYTVSGLIDPVTVSQSDIFEGVTVEFDGIAPMVEANLSVEPSEYGDLISYEIIDEEKYYDEGDSVMVRAIFDEEELAENNLVSEIPSENCVKAYSVEGVDRYITRTEDVTDEMMASLQKEALTLFTDANEYGMRIFCDAGLVPVYINKKTTFVWNSPHYISSYLNVLKEESFGKVGTHCNDIKLCYESVISQADGKACKAEVVVRFQDIILRADGTVDLNLESGDIISADRRDSHIKQLVNNTADNDYESEKISA